MYHTFFFFFFLQLVVFNIQQQLHGDTIILILDVKLAFYSTKNERCWEFILSFFLSCY